MLTQTFVRSASTLGCVLALFSFWCTPGAQAQGEPHNALVYRVTNKVSQLTLVEREARLLELPARTPGGRNVDRDHPAHDRRLGQRLDRGALAKTQGFGPASLGIEALPV